MRRIAFLISTFLILATPLLSLFGCGRLWGEVSYLQNHQINEPQVYTGTWVSGSSTAFQIGTYGVQGTGSISNIPGARLGAVSWIDVSGNLWLFGGSGLDSTGANGFLNDLWEYTPSTQNWTWFSGSNLRNGTGAYGVQGTGSTLNIPGGRQPSNSWIDNAGNLAPIDLPTYAIFQTLTP